MTATTDNLFLSYTLRNFDKKMVITFIIVCFCRGSQAFSSNNVVEYLSFII